MQPHSAQLGKINRLIILRDSDHGFYLDGGELGEILLPNREVPEDVEQGDEVEVFISRDSEDRIVATSTRPVCEVGDFVMLEVKAVNRKIGAFLDWGYPKDLLLPFREQLRRVKPGEKVLVHVYLDEVSNRIVASARTNRFLNKRRPEYDIADEVSLLIQEETPLGYMAIIDGQFRGLLHRERVSRTLRVGEKYDGYIAALKPDEKIDLSLEPIGYRRVTTLGDRIMTELAEEGGKLPFGDKTAPEEIRNHFGVSKKAFKQALGALYRERKIKVAPDSIEKVD
ncbi:MAG: S1-like domain-containing RNA-binding protein [Verrucomicrobiales bacterium]|nr:S1-like domain-containing RNA-binding protein [Verrucomicrobiales bacterium]